jgi:Recombinase/Recombinase zinc beta ribbon domain
MKRAALYARVSTDAQQKEATISSQLSALKRQIAAAGAALNMLGAFSQFERAKIIERTTRGRLHRLREGRMMSQGHCIYGYRYVRKSPSAPASLDINPHEAAIVRSVFEMYAGGDGIRRIMRTLEERGVPTRKGKLLWRPEQVRYMLKNHTYTGIRYFNRMTLTKETPAKPDAIKNGSHTFRDRSEWIGVSVPAIVPQELFDRVHERLQKIKEHYRHPLTHYLLGGLVECGECGAGFSSYRRYVTKDLTIGKRRVYHKAAYKCNWRTHQGGHARNVKRCHNSEVATHLLEEKVFELIREFVFDPVKLCECISALKAEEANHGKIEYGLMRIARQIQATEDEKKRLIDLYASGNMSEETYINENVALDQELHRLKLKKEEFSGLPLLHKESIDVSIRHFCDNAKARFAHCFNFDTKRQFLLDHAEKIIYHRYKVTVIGSVPIRTQTSDGRESETRKLPFCITGEVDTTMLHRRPRKKFAEDGRLRAWGSGGRREPTVAEPVP